MKCFKCGKKADIEYQKHRICEKCFIYILEKRIRKFIRLNDVFSKKDKILIVGELAGYFIKSLLDKNPCEKTYRKRKVKGDFDKIVIEWTMDDEIDSFFYSWFNGKKEKKFPKKYVKLLLPITDEEALKAAKILKIKFVPRKKNKDIKHIVDFMSSKYSETRYNIVKRIAELKEMTG